MSWPAPPNNTPVPTTHLDSGADKPADARADIKLLTDRVNSLEAVLKQMVQNGSPVITARSDGMADAGSLIDGAVSKRAFNPGYSVGPVTWPNAASIFTPDTVAAGTGIYVDITSDGGIIKADGIVNYNVVCTNGAVASIEIICHLKFQIIGSGAASDTRGGSSDHRRVCVAFGGLSSSASTSFSALISNPPAGSVCRFWVGMVQIRAFDVNGVIVAPGAGVQLQRGLFVSAVEINK